MPGISGIESSRWLLNASMAYGKRAIDDVISAVQFIMEHVPLEE